MQNNINISGSSVEDAVVGLRKRINQNRNEVIVRLKNGALFLLPAVRLILLLSLVYFLEGLFFCYVVGSPLLFLVAFMVSIAAILFGFWRRNATESGEILIGRAYAHESESVTLEGRRKNVRVGRDGLRYVDYLAQPNHHILINGSTSSGKTVTMLTFAARASIENEVNFLVLDWNGENEEWARSVGATLWKVPLNFKINPFKLNGMAMEARASRAAESLAVAAHLTALQAAKVKSALLRFYMDGKEPSLFELWNIMCAKDAGKGSVLSQRFRIIQRVVGYEPEEFWSGIFDGNNVVSLAGLNESEKALVVYVIIQRMTEYFDSVPEKERKLKLMIVMDEAWQFFRHERSFDVHKESSLEKVVRLGRKYGFGLAISSQQIEDVPKVFLNSCSLVMLHQQREYSYFGKDIIGLDAFEAAYLKSAAQGELLLLDRGMAQQGRWWNDYVKVMPISDEERIMLREKSKGFTPKEIEEPELPIEMHENGFSVGEAKEKGILEEIDLPSVAVYRFLLALQREKNLTNAYDFLIKNEWLTSSSSIHGSQSRPSIMERAIASGYVNEDGVLTLRGASVVDPSHMIENQGVRAGSEEHKELMKRTITMIQGRGNLAFVPFNKDSFDVGEIDAESKHAWSFKSFKIYECQTNAIKGEIEKCLSRAKAFNTVPTIVVKTLEMKNQVIELVKGAAECISLDEMPNDNDK
jgi:hypothetical protein